MEPGGSRVGQKQKWGRSGSTPGSGEEHGRSRREQRKIRVGAEQEQGRSRAGSGQDQGRSKAGV